MSISTSYIHEFHLSFPKPDDPLVKINRHIKLEHNSEISKTLRDADKPPPLQARAITNAFVFLTLFIKPMNAYQEYQN